MSFSRNNLFSFIFELIAAFIVWTFKGFKGKFTDEISGPNESSNRRTRNTIISIIVLLIILAIFTEVKKKSEKKKETITFEVK